MNYIIANWKMNMDTHKTALWIENFDNKPAENNEVIIAPSSLHLPLIQQIKNKLNIKLCAQDVSMFSKGSHTGETGAFQLRDFCDYCIVGHSERKEDLETVIKKRDICLENDITPIVCFTNPGDAKKYERENVILAWEDPDNISQEGEFRPKDPEKIKEGINIIKNQISSDIPIIYGGSVNRQNIADLVNINELNGILVGSASLDPQHFKQLTESF